jgi:hypothetical protein
MSPHTRVERNGFSVSSIIADFLGRGLLVSSVTMIETSTPPMSSSGRSDQAG